MKFFAQLVVLMGVYVTVTSAFNCDLNPDQWHRVPNSRKCVRVVEGVVGPLSTADEHCGALTGSRVLTIKSQEEQDFVRDLLFNRLQMEDDVWLGGQRQSYKFMWRNDGQLIDGGVYSNWAPSRPTSNFPKACLLLQSNNTAYPGKWVDQYCFSVAAVVCENFHRDVLPDKPDNDDNTEEPDTGNQCRDCVNEAVLNRRLNEMREEFERRMDEMGQQIDRQRSAMEKLFSALNDRYHNFGNLIEVNRHAISRLNQRMEFIDGLNLGEIGHNFTGVANVLKHFNSQIENIVDRLEDISNNNGNNNNDVDLSDIRKELQNYVKDLVNDLQDGDAVTDVRLQIVSYRRTLQIEKNGKWKSVGHV